MPLPVSVLDLTSMVCECIIASGTREVGTTIPDDALPITGATSLRATERDEHEIMQIIRKLQEDHLHCDALPADVKEAIVESFTNASPDFLVIQLCRRIHPVLLRHGIVCIPPERPTLVLRRPLSGSSGYPIEVVDV